jgi:hypothetical protein
MPVLEASHQDMTMPQRLLTPKRVPKPRSNFARVGNGEFVLTRDSPSRLPRKCKRSWANKLRGGDDPSDFDFLFTSLQ